MRIVSGGGSNPNEPFDQSGAFQSGAFSQSGVFIQSAFDSHPASASPAHTIAITLYIIAYPSDWAAPAPGHPERIRAGLMLCNYRGSVNVNGVNHLCGECV